jgi:hypothetical protein
VTPWAVAASGRARRAAVMMAVDRMVGFSFNVTIGRRRA